MNNIVQQTLRLKICVIRQMHFDSTVLLKIIFILILLYLVLFKASEIYL